MRSKNNKIVTRTKNGWLWNKKKDMIRGEKTRKWREEEEKGVLWKVRISEKE